VLRILAVRLSEMLPHTYQTTRHRNRDDHIQEYVQVFVHSCGTMAHNLPDYTVSIRKTSSVLAALTTRDFMRVPRFITSCAAHSCSSSSLSQISSYVTAVSAQPYIKDKQDVSLCDIASPVMSLPLYQSSSLSVELVPTPKRPQLLVTTLCTRPTVSQIFP
jgi:hypothetical protein